MKSICQFTRKIPPNQNELVFRFDPSLLKRSENMIQFKSPEARSLGNDTRLSQKNVFNRLFQNIIYNKKVSLLLNK